jgi:hypothetical protein
MKDATQTEGESRLEHFSAFLVLHVISSVIGIVRRKERQKAKLVSKYKSKKNVGPRRIQTPLIKPASPRNPKLNISVQKPHNAKGVPIWHINEVVVDITRERLHNGIRY